MLAVVVKTDREIQHFTVYFSPEMIVVLRRLRGCKYLLIPHRGFEGPESTEACTITIDRAKSKDNVLKRRQDFLSVTLDDVARSLRSYTINA